jgi:hypothetical protein
MDDLETEANLRENVKKLKATSNSEMPTLKDEHPDWWA